MTVRREQYFTYLLLGVFSLIALVPVAGIIITALQKQGGLTSFGHPGGFHLSNFADAWREGNFADYLRSRVKYNKAIESGHIASGDGRVVPR